MTQTFEERFASSMMSRENFLESTSTGIELVIRETSHKTPIKQSNAMSFSEE